MFLASCHVLVGFGAKLYRFSVAFLSNLGAKINENSVSKAPEEQFSRFSWFLSHPRSDDPHVFIVLGPHSGPPKRQNNEKRRSENQSKKRSVQKLLFGGAFPEFWSLWLQFSSIWGPKLGFRRDFLRRFSSDRVWTCFFTICSEETPKARKHTLLKINVLPRKNYDFQGSPSWKTNTLYHKYTSKTTLIFRRFLA